MKNGKLKKILSQLFSGAVDLLPGGTTVKSIVQDVVNKKLDRNGDGKVSLADFKPVELAGLFGGLAVLSYLTSQGIIDIQVLKEIVKMFGL